MADTNTSSTTKRLAVVTGANKGIGLEICRQLASNGVAVVLTARDEKKGVEAVETLEKESGLSDVVFHQLDVKDPASIASLSHFIKTQFGVLDILVNNAGVSGIIFDDDAIGVLTAEYGSKEVNLAKFKQVAKQTAELAEECIQANYYGTKRVTEALLPILQLSDSPRIVNVSASAGKLQNISQNWVKELLSDIDGLTEERADEAVNKYLKEFKQGSIETQGWPAYSMSKAALNAYTRILSKKLPEFRINCVCPGYVKSDFNYNTGNYTVEEGAEGPVKLALLTDDGPSGLFFFKRRLAIVTGANKGIGLEICRQLALNGVAVVLTARDEKRGVDAVEKLKKESGLSDVVFHQLDVKDPDSIASLSHFIQTQFGVLDILVNNAAVTGIVLDDDAYGALMAVDGPQEVKAAKLRELARQTYETAGECLQANYYGTKKVTEALLPILQLSNSPRIVNVSSSAGKLQRISHTWAKEVLSDVDGLTEERVDEALNKFLKDFKEGLIENHRLPAYCVSKAALNAYTRILSKNFPKLRINYVCPGSIKSDLNYNIGKLTAEEGAEGPVKLALLTEDGPSGLFCFQKEVTSFD